MPGLARWSTDSAPEPGLSHNNVEPGALDGDESLTRAEFDEWSQGYVSPGSKPGRKKGGRTKESKTN